ncbi:MAG: hypothetical protein DMD91_34510 [Candidatus Rokuibacteriota bacterium]|nr:MAG: hypothetical protein DMD91_34510 [Candidatus Rokubacteria bacterium]
MVGVGRTAPRCAEDEFFYSGPIGLNPLAPAAIIALLRAQLGALWTEATRPSQPLSGLGLF